MRASILLMAGLAGGLLTVPVHAGISYDVNGSVYTETFTAAPFVNGMSGLPSTDTGGGAINGGGSTQLSAEGWADGWADDTTTTNTHISVPGWHLYHETDLGTPNSTEEGGTNGHQRARFGTGSSSTGSFWMYASSSGSNTEKALGILSSNTIQAGGTRAYIGLQLINNTGQTLTSFTVTYDGEQWRDGDVDTGGADRFDFQYSLTKTDANWFDSSGYAGIADSFVAPIQVTGAAALDGNAAANRVADITHTINDIVWAPGAELWIRWRDGNISSDDDGIAIDNVRFTAVPEPASLGLLGIGAAALLVRRRSR